MSWSFDWSWKIPSIPKQQDIVLNQIQSSNQLGEGLSLCQKATQSLVELQSILKLNKIKKIRLTLKIEKGKNSKLNEFIYIKKNVNK